MAKRKESKIPGGRVLTEHEQEAWRDYQTVLDKYHEKYKVRFYDRDSIHEHFPEIKAAFDYCCELSKKTKEFQEVYDILRGADDSSDKEFY